MNSLSMNELTLGLDLGTTSIGWCLINEENQNIEKMGVRIFDEGVDRDQFGVESSKNKQRRDARLARRTRDRRMMRMYKLFNILQESSLLPNYTETQLTKINAPFEVQKSKQAIKKEIRRRKLEARQEIIQNLDINLLEKWETILPHKPHLYKIYKKTLPNVFPYFLRKIALDEKLEAYEIGRALFHLGQRRGFLSNRKSGKSSDDGKVLGGIKKIYENMEENEYRTLGELFSTFDPDKIRIRNKYTSRKMYDDEFKQIINSQISLGNNNFFDNREIQKSIYKSIFYQRPLKSVKKFIGFCSLEKDKRRMKIAFLDAQEFRARQTINNLRILNTSSDKLERVLTLQEKELVYNEFFKKDKVKVSALKKTLNLSKEEKFKYEENEIKGNTTVSKIFSIYKEFLNISKIDQEKMVNALISFDSQIALEKHFKEKWNLDPEVSSKLSQINLEDGYLAYSSTVVAKILPFLREGMDLYEAKIKAGYTDNDDKSIFNLLPSYRKVDSSLRNPIVLRTLSELRKVVNNIVKKYGKPKQIRVELARDLKKGKDFRENILKNNKNRANERALAKEKILEYSSNMNVSRRDIDKYLLFVECNHQCPYTGESISMDALFGAMPQFDIEHIIPLSRSLDDSFLNKTLCYHDENRRVKKNQTPYEAYAIGSPEKYSNILKRVNNFTGNGKYKKLSLFKLKDATSEQDFASQMLNDTRYASKLAKNYLGLLYGGEIDSENILRIRASTGQVTAYLRNMWKLNSILSQDDKKSRNDHRHHAVDALVIALTSEKSIQLLNKAARNAERESKNKFGKLDKIWETLLEQAQEHVSNIQVSFRVERKINGSLHKETFYGKNSKDKLGENFVPIRKPIDMLTDRELENIIDPYVKDSVLSKLAEFGTKIPKKAFKLDDETTLPFLIVKHNDQHKRPFAKQKGEKIYIKSVRVKARSASPLQIGKGLQQRNVQPDENHHIAYYEIQKGKKVTWEAIVVSRLEAMIRKQNGVPVIDKDALKEKGGIFKFSLMKGDTIEITDKNGEVKLRSVKSVTSDMRIYHSPSHDARPQNDRIKTGDFPNVSPSSLYTLKCKKIVVSPLGDLFESHE